MIRFTGEVQCQIRAIDSIEYGPLGASVELQLLIEPDADDAFRGLWSSEGHNAPEVIPMRTVCRPDHIAVGVDQADQVSPLDVDAVISHLAAVNDAYERLRTNGEAAAQTVAQRLGGA